MCYVRSDSYIQICFFSLCLALDNVECAQIMCSSLWICVFLSHFNYLLMQYNVTKNETVGAILQKDIAQFVQ